MELEPGTSIAGYEIVRHVTSGGMAELYLARRLGAAGFEKIVALKLVHQELAQDDDFITMFLDEARLASKIAHPNVVSVEELREVDGQYLMAMEYVDGFALAQVLSKLSKARLPLPPEIAVWIAMQVAEGLHAAHELRDDHGQLLQVVHRDVSPQNVLVSRDGYVKVIDFGIAKSRMASRRTQAGVVRGKLQYMAPEQAKGYRLDRRVDVYAVGVLLWEMLTMRRLFHSADERELLHRVQQPRIKPPSEFAPISGPLDEAVMAALAVDPEQRLPSALALRQALIEACPPAASVHAGRLAEVIASVDDHVATAPIEASETRAPRSGRRRISTKAKTPSAMAAEPLAESPTRVPSGPRRRPSPPAVASPPATPPPRPPPRSAPPTSGAAPVEMSSSSTFEGPPPDAADLVELPPAPAPDRAPVFEAPPSKRPFAATLLLFLIAAGIGAGFYFWIVSKL